jgi:hypothetical protein
LITSENYLPAEEEKKILGMSLFDIFIQLSSIGLCAPVEACALLTLGSPQCAAF